MKKLVLCLTILLLSVPVMAEMTQQEAKEALKDKGYLYGCTPANWSLVEPVRGGFNWAALHNEVDIMDLEVKAGLDITTCGRAVGLQTIMFKKTEALDFLLHYGYNPNQLVSDHSYLTFAIYRKNPQAVKILIENGADVNMLGKGKHPLNSAIKKKQPEIVKMLLDAGAKPNEKTAKLVKKTKNQEIKSYFNEL